MSERLQADEVERSLEPANEASADELRDPTSTRYRPLLPALREANFEEGAQLLKPEDTLLGDLFRRIDASGDKGISKGEVKSHLKRVGIKSGFLGLVHSTVADKFMENLDLNEDGQVTMDEFGAIAQELLPAELFDSDGQIKYDELDSFMTRLDVDGSGGIEYSELYSGTKSNLPEDQSHKGTIAEVAAKLGMDGLDTDASGAITLEELENAADAVAAARAAGGG